jgi:hypothetical protein
MSIQQNFPAISPSLSLNFARSKTLDPRITFTRTSSATRVNGQGLIEVIPANSARFDHSYDPVSGTVRSLGLLIEEQRVNLLLRSEEFGNASWTTNKIGTTVTANQAEAPNGTQTADILIPDAGVTVSTITSASSTSIRQDITKAASAITYTFSVYAKSAGYNAIRLATRDEATGLNQATITFSLANGTILTAAASSGTFSSASGSVLPVGNGWYRCVFTYTTSTETGNRFLILPANTTSTTADGTSGIYVWGAQLEQASFPTSYIPTSGSTVTRTADNASMVGENFSSWYNQSEGSIYCSFYRNLEPSTFHYPVGVRDQSDVNNRIHILFSTAFDGIIRGGIIKDGVTQADSFTGAVYSRTSINKSIISYEENNVTAAASGSLGGTNTTAQIPQNINQMVVGAIGPTGQLNGHISQLTYYPKRLPNAFLQNLTK